MDKVVQLKMCCYDCLVIGEKCIELGKRENCRGEKRREEATIEAAAWF